jgi:hypothetical protein
MKMNRSKRTQQALLASICWVWGASGAWAQSTGAARQVAPVQATVDAPLSQAEMALVTSVLLGTKPCELGRSVRIEPDEQQPGYFRLTSGTHRYRLRPVETSTGAVRLEDKAQGAVWIQLPHKSMLMNQKLGQRLADECASPVQRAAAEAAKANPAPHLLDVAQTPR